MKIAALLSLMACCLTTSLDAQAAARTGVQLRGHISNTPAYQAIGRLASDDSMQVVTDASGNLFIAGLGGSLHAVPPGTDIGTLMAGGAHGKRTPHMRARMWNPLGAREVMGPVTLTYVADDGSKPMEMSSRQYVVNGVATSGGGSLIREYSPRNSQSFARLYAKKR